MRRAQAAGFVLSALLGAYPIALAAPAADEGPGLFFDVQPVTLEGRCLVPIRPIFEWLGAKVVYEGGHIKAFHARESAVPQVELWLGSTEARISGARYELDVAPQTIEGRTFVPLRFVAESFGVWVQAKGPQMVLSIPQENRSAVMAIPPDPRAHLGKIWHVVQLWYGLIPSPKEDPYPHWHLYSTARQREVRLTSGAQAAAATEAQWDARTVGGIRILDGRVLPGAEEGWVEVMVKYEDGVETQRLEFVRQPAGWRVEEVVKE